MKTRRRHRGPSLDSFLKDEGVYDELHELVAKEALVWQLQREMKKRRMTKSKLAVVMRSSRAQIDRILDPASGNVTLATLQKAANAVGKTLKVELV